MTPSPLAAYLEVVQADEARLHLVRLIRVATEAMDKARRESASEPASSYARAATIILNEALVALDRLAEEGRN